MYKMWKRFLAVSLAVLLLLSAPMGANIFAGFALTASAASYSGTCGENLTWTLDTDTGILTISGTGEMKDYSYHYNYNSEAPWYSNRSSIREVRIADGVTSIGDYAFYDCTSLTSVTIPDSVTSIGDSAFEYCTSLTSVTIPDSVTSIGDLAFYYCTSLTSITVKEGNPKYLSDEYGVLLNKDKTLLIQYPVGNTRTSYIIPDSVTSIGSSAFESCDSLTSVTIGDSVTSIGDDAFRYCDSLTSVTIPDSVTSIGDEAFYSCDSLTSVTIPDSVTSIGYYAFRACTSLTSITIPDSVTSIGYSAFEDCTSLTSVTIPDSVTSIGSSAFYNTEIYNNASNWENDVLYIGNHLIEAKESITGGYLVRTGTKTIADDAFCDCTRLTSVTIPDSVTNIGEQAFYNTEIYNNASNWENDVLYIGNHLIEAKTSITGDYLVKSGTKTIADDAFFGCTSLTSITIPDSVTSIGRNAFHACTSLTNVNVGNSVTSIGAYAFAICVSLASVTIPKSLTDIGVGAFMQLGIDTEELEDIRKAYNEALLSGQTEINGTPLQFFKSILDHPQGSLSDVYYLGTHEEWNAVGIDEGNESLLNATIHCMDDKPPCEHNYMATITTPPTCTAVGECTYTCDICGDSYTKEVDALGHDYSIIAVMQKPSCTENGYNIVFCAHDMTHNYLVPTYATGHSYDSVVTAPTCTEQGYTTHTCTVCGDSYRDNFVDPLPAIFIRNYKGETTVDYRTTVTFAAEVPKPIDGAEIHWFVDGKDVGTGDTYTVKEAKKDINVQARYMEGKTVIAESEIETVKVKSGFFDKLIAFFRALFKKLPVLTQEYLGIEHITTR